MKDVVATTIPASLLTCGRVLLSSIGFTEILKPAPASRVCYGGNKPEENIMPVILLWGIPALIVIGGGSYWLIHLHH